jgi:hypothetical protein
MEMIRDRNHSSHTYNLEVAKGIASRIEDSYIRLFLELQQTCRDLADEIKS